MWLYFLSIKKPKLLNYRLITRYVILLRNHRENSGIMVAVLQKKKNGGQDNTAPRRCQFSRAFYLFTEYSLERKFNMLNRYLNLKWEFLQIST